jgi:hypothetical protein
MATGFRARARQERALHHFVPVGRWARPWRVSVCSCDRLATAPWQSTSVPEQAAAPRHLGSPRQRTRQGAAGAGARRQDRLPGVLGSLPKDGHRPRLRGTYRLGRRDAITAVVSPSAARPQQYLRQLPTTNDANVLTCWFLEQPTQLKLVNAQVGVLPEPEQVRRSGPRCATPVPTWVGIPGRYTGTVGSPAVLSNPRVTLGQL